MMLLYKVEVEVKCLAITIDCGSSKVLDKYHQSSWDDTAVAVCPDPRSGRPLWCYVQSMASEWI